MRLLTAILIGLSLWVLSMLGHAIEGHTALAAKYGLSISAVARARARKTWRTL